MQLRSFVINDMIKQFGQSTGNCQWLAAFARPSSTKLTVYVCYSSTGKTIFHCNVASITHMGDATMLQHDLNDMCWLTLEYNRSFLQMLRSNQQQDRKMYLWCFSDCCMFRQPLELLGDNHTNRRGLTFKATRSQFIPWQQRYLAPVMSLHSTGDVFLHRSNDKDLSKPICKMRWLPQSRALFGGRLSWNMPPPTEAVPD